MAGRRERLAAAKEAAAAITGQVSEPEIAPLDPRYSREWPKPTVVPNDAAMCKITACHQGSGQVTRK